jgi:hypothetical protein
MALTLNQQNCQAFRVSLERAYGALFANDPNYAYSAARTTPAALAEKMTIGLAKGEANKDGEGVKTACKALGIAYTYKAIAAYLTAA